MLGKIQQIAIATDDAKELIEKFKALGLKNWVHDTVLAGGTIFGIQDENKASLNFNYDLGFELEVLQYLEGPCWHDYRVDQGSKFPFLSHIGYHVESEEVLEQTREAMLKMGIGVAQEVHTIEHTNPFLVENKRKFHYVVFDSKQQLGFDLKLIVRKNHEAK